MKKSIAATMLLLLGAISAKADDETIFKGRLDKGSSHLCGDRDIIWHVPSKNTKDCKVSYASLGDYELTTNTCSFRRGRKLYRRAQALSFNRSARPENVTLTVTEYRAKNPGSIQLECTYSGSVSGRS